MSDEVTIDVGPVFCPSCKREFGNTERDRLASLLEELRPYADHRRVECDSGLSRCVCGLAGLLADIPRGEP